MPCVPPCRRPASSRATRPGRTVLPCMHRRLRVSARVPVGAWYVNECAYRYAHAYAYDAQVCVQMCAQVCGRIAFYCYDIPACYYARACASVHGALPICVCVQAPSSVKCAVCMRPPTHTTPASHDLIHASVRALTIFMCKVMCARVCAAHDAVR
jgi:hypothetical protein